MQKWIMLFVIFFLHVDVMAQTVWQQNLEAVGEYLTKNKLTRAAIVATQDGDSIRTKGFGQLGNGQSPDQDTMFEIGSITKVFTGLALARMYVDGYLQLDTKLEDIYPQTKGKTLGLVTLRQLSTHTSGIPSVSADMMPFADPDNPYQGYSFAKLENFLNTFELTDYPVAFEGAKHYSNLGVGALSYTLSRTLHPANPGDYDLLMRETIFDDLGIEDIAVSLTKEQQTRFAKPHRASWHETPPFVMGILAGAGALKASARSLLSFSQYIMNPPSGEVGKALALAQEVHAESESFSGGLGWMIYPHEGVQWLIHGGATYGAYSWLGINPTDRRVAMILTDTGSPLHCFEVRAIGVECSFPEISDVNIKFAQKSPGIYSHSEAGKFIVVTERNRVFGRFLGGPEFMLYPKSEDELLFPMGQITLKFGDEDGEGFREVLVTSEQGEFVYIRE